jgi:hypothetical protein
MSQTGARAQVMGRLNNMWALGWVSAPGDMSRLDDMWALSWIGAPKCPEDATVHRGCQHVFKDEWANQTRGGEKTFGRDSFR